MKKHLKGKRVVVTGADGFIGSHLTEALFHTGAHVSAVAQYNSFDNFGWLDDLPTEIKSDIKIVRGDVRDSSFIDRLIQGNEIVFHLAALIAIPHSYDAPQSYVDVNVTGTLNVLEAARKHNVERVVHTSTSEVYGTALEKPISEGHPLQGQSPYSASKIAADMMAEAYARSFDLQVMILRPFNTFGPRQSERAVISSITRQALDPTCEEIHVGDLTPTRDFNFVGNTTDAFLHIGTSDTVKPGTAYNAGSGVEVSIKEVADKIINITGTNKPIRQEASRIRPNLSEVRALVADASKIKEACGWMPEVDLDTGLLRTVAWWDQRIREGKTRSSSAYVT